MMTSTVRIKASGLLLAQPHQGQPSEAQKDTTAHGMVDMPSGLRIRQFNNGGPAATSKSRPMTTLVERQNALEGSGILVGDQARNDI